MSIVARAFAAQQERRRRRLLVGNLLIAGAEPEQETGQPGSRGRALTSAAAVAQAAVSEPSQQHVTAVRPCPSQQRALATLRRLHPTATLLAGLPSSQGPGPPPGRRRWRKPLPWAVQPPRPAIERTTSTAVGHNQPNPDYGACIDEEYAAATAREAWGSLSMIDQAHSRRGSTPLDAHHSTTASAPLSEANRPWAPSLEHMEAAARYAQLSARRAASSLPGGTATAPEARLASAPEAATAAATGTASNYARIGWERQGQPHAVLAAPSSACSPLPPPLPSAGAASHLLHYGPEGVKRVAAAIDALLAELAAAARRGDSAALPAAAAAAEIQSDWEDRTHAQICAAREVVTMLTSILTHANTPHGGAEQSQSTVSFIKDTVLADAKAADENVNAEACADVHDLHLHFSWYPGVRTAWQRAMRGDVGAAAALRELDAALQGSGAVTAWLQMAEDDDGGAGIAAAACESSRRSGGGGGGGAASWEGEAGWQSEQVAGAAGSGAGGGAGNGGVVAALVPEFYRPLWCWLLARAEGGSAMADLVFRRALCGLGLLLAGEPGIRLHADPFLLAASCSCYACLTVGSSDQPVSPRHVFVVLCSGPVPFTLQLMEHARSDAEPRASLFPVAMSYGHLVTTINRLTKRPANALAWADLLAKHRASPDFPDEDIRKQLEAIALEVAVLEFSMMWESCGKDPPGAERPVGQLEAGAGRPAPAPRLSCGESGRSDQGSSALGLSAARQTGADEASAARATGDSGSSGGEGCTDASDFGGGGGAQLTRGDGASFFALELLRLLLLTPPTEAATPEPQSTTHAKASRKLPRPSAPKVAVSEASEAPAQQEQGGAAPATHTLQLPSVEHAALALAYMCQSRAAPECDFVMQPEPAHPPRAQLGDSQTSAARGTSEAALRAAAGDAAVGRSPEAWQLRLRVARTLDIPANDDPRFGRRELTRSIATMTANCNYAQQLKLLREGLLKRRQRRMWVQCTGVEGVRRALTALAQVRQEMRDARMDLCVCIAELKACSDGSSGKQGGGEGSHRAEGRAEAAIQSNAATLTAAPHGRYDVKAGLKRLDVSVWGSVFAKAKEPPPAAVAGAAASSSASTGAASAAGTTGPSAAAERHPLDRRYVCIAQNEAQRLLALLRPGSCHPARDSLFLELLVLECAPDRPWELAASERPLTGSSATAAPGAVSVPSRRAQELQRLAQERRALQEALMGASA